MKITANGIEYDIPEAQSLPDFITARGLVPSRVVIERNGEALTPAEARDAVLAPGDRLEIVRVVAGG